jgi:hypothetical protein
MISAMSSRALLLPSIPCYVSFFFLAGILYETLELDKRDDGQDSGHSGVHVCVR